MVPSLLLISIDVAGNGEVRSRAGLIAYCSLESENPKWTIV